MHGSWDKKLRSFQSRCLKLFMNCSIKVHCFNSLELGDLLHAGLKVGVARNLLATIKSSKHENVDKSCPTQGTHRRRLLLHRHSIRMLFLNRRHLLGEETLVNPHLSSDLSRRIPTRAHPPAASNDSSRGTFSKLRGRLS